MTFDRVVLVHGAMHGSWCWERVLPRLECDAVAVDLPGRPGAAPVPPTLENWTDCVVDATTTRSLLVAHSLAGLVALTAATRAPDRVAGIAFVAAVIARRGQCYWDLLPRPFNIIRRALHIGDSEVIMPRLVARFALCRGLKPADRDAIMSRLVPESGTVLGTPVSYRLSDSLDLAYVHTERDWIVTPAQQRRYVEILPARTRRLRLDCGHSAMYARPAELASIINQMARPGLDQI